MMNFTVSFAELMPLMPVIIVVLTAIVVMMLTAFKRHHGLIATASVLGLNAALFYIAYDWLQAYRGVEPLTIAPVMGMFMVDSFTSFYQMMILVAALACCTLSHAYIERYEGQKEELYILMLFSVVGAMLMVASTHYASFFISLELMSVPIYGMLAYTHQRRKSLESGIKYLVLSATASAMLLMGMAFLYAYTGTLSFYATADGLPSAITVFKLMQAQPFVVLGVAMMIFAIAFKLSLAPFHKWTPDVYNGAPAPIATFLATAAKVATIGFFLRYVLSSALVLYPSVQLLLIIIAIASVLMGNVLALRQGNLKRILAYSSIAHFGYLLLAIMSGMYVSVASVSMYVLTYTLTTIGAFGVITLMSSPYRQDDDIERLDDYRGIFWKHPVLTSTLTVMMLSLAGIPLTAGFIAKFLIAKEMVLAGQWLLMAVLIIGSGIGLYYYLRVIVTLYKKPLDDAMQASPIAHWGQKAGGMLILLVTALVLIIGVYPDPILYVLDQLHILSPFHDYYQNFGAEYAGHAGHGGHEGHHGHAH